MLTPLDFHGKEFLKAFRGYDTDEVDKFFELAARDFERLYQDNIEIKAALARATTKIEYFEQMEITMNNVISIAQETATDVKRTGKKEIEILKKEAEAEALNIVSEAKNAAQKETKLAETYGFETRKNADEYRQKVMSDADEYSEKTILEANNEAKRILEEANIKLAEIQKKCSEEKDSFKDYQSKVKSLLKEELEVIERYEKD